MIRDKIINLDDDNAPIELYYDNDGLPISKAQFLNEIQLREFECPACHADTFGRFEPFVRKGVLRWCSVCGFSEFDKQLHAQWLAKHPEDITE